MSVKQIIRYTHGTNDMIYCILLTLTTLLLDILMQIGLEAQKIARTPQEDGSSSGTILCFGSARNRIV